MASTISMAPRWQRISAALTGAVVGFVFVAGLQWGRPVLIPIATAVLLTLLLAPIVQRLESGGVHHIVAVLLTVTTASFLLLALAWMMMAQVTRMLADLPKNTETIKTKIRSVRQLESSPIARQFSRMLDELSAELGPSPNRPESPGEARQPDAKPKPTAARPQIVEPATSLVIVTRYLGSAIETLGAVAFAGVLIVFFLLEGRELRDRLVVLAGKARLTVTSKALDEINGRITRYLGMVAVLNGGFGLILSGMLYLVGLPYALLWGFVAAAFRFIPYIGPWIGAIFPIIMSLALSPGWWQPFAVFACVVTLELVSNNLVEPFVFGRTTGVSPTALLICAALWLYLWGPLGLVLSIPFAVCLVVIGKNIPELRFLTLLLSDEPALTVDASFYQRLMLGDSQEANAIIASHLKATESPNVYEELLIPALNYAKLDIRRRRVTLEEYKAILGLIRESLRHVDELMTVEKTNDAAKEASNSDIQLTIIGCPASDDADLLALEILQHRLNRTRRNVQISASETSHDVLVTRITAEPPGLVCIASVPPGSQTRTRRLCKRLRAAVPDIPIIVGRWGPEDESPELHEQLMLDGASFVTNTQTETCNIVDWHVSRTKQSESENSGSDGSVK